jgi:hypothetical protein
MPKIVGAYHDSSQARIRKIGGYTTPDVYVTGGDPITPAHLGMSRIELILFSSAIGGAGGLAYLTPVYVPTPGTGGGTIKLVDAASGVEAAAGAMSPPYYCRFEAIGT